MTDLTYTHPDVLTIGVDDGWADPETDPTRIDWAARQAAAAIPFDVVDGRPVNPFGPTGIRYGRNQCGHWGEALAADALVLATLPAGWAQESDPAARYVLMVERDDGHGWAIPGGHVEPGEPAQAAAVRELEEETGLRLLGVSWRDWHQSAPRYVPDPRASDEAWMATVLCVLDLGHVEELPPVEGYDDAYRAAWIRADSYAALTADLDQTYAGSVFAAHVEMLKATLDSPRPVAGLDQQPSLGQRR
jgi:ADP-ribose pyrophosphatase